jgi:hypothetical protein
MLQRDIHCVIYLSYHDKLPTPPMKKGLRFARLKNSAIPCGRSLVKCRLLVFFMKKVKLFTLQDYCFFACVSHSKTSTKPLFIYISSSCSVTTFCCRHYIILFVKLRITYVPYLMYIVTF